MRCDAMRCYKSCATEVGILASFVDRRGDPYDFGPIMSDLLCFASRYNTTVSTSTRNDTRLSQNY